MYFMSAETALYGYNMLSCIGNPAGTYNLGEVLGDQSNKNRDMSQE